MKSLLRLLVLAVACVLPAKPQSNVTDYSITFIPPDGALITYFAVTLVIPSVPPDNTAQCNFQDVWYGVGQSGFPHYLGHIIDEDNGPPSNEWNFLPIYCCDPTKKQTNISLNLFPGDTITSIFTKAGDGGWNNSWSQVPGPTFPNTAIVGFTGYNNLGPDSLVGPPMTQAVLSIEVGGTNTWDFGPVTFTNIQIEAETTNPDPSWCDSDPFISTNNQQEAPFIFHVNGTLWQEKGNSTSCNINSIVFLGRLVPGNQNPSTTAPATSSTSPSTRSAVGGPSASSKSGVGKIEAHFGGLFLVISTFLSILC